MVEFSKFINGQRNSKQLVDSDGYIYLRKEHRDTPLTTAWRCNKFKSKPVKCPCHVYLSRSDNELSTSSNPHTHPPDILVVEHREFISNLKRKAADQHLSATQNLVTEVLANSTAELNVELPKLESLSRIVQRSRAKSSGSSLYHEANTAAKFILPPTCQLTIRGDQFTFVNGYTDCNSRLILYATNRNLDTLVDYPDWICDGTFYVAPKLFTQSYSIHSIIDGKCVPLVFALLEDKKETTYTYLLKLLKLYFDNFVNISEGTVMIDFELAVSKSFKIVFPGFKIKKLFFSSLQKCSKTNF